MPAIRFPVIEEHSTVDTVSEALAPPTVNMPPPETPVAANLFPLMMQSLISTMSA
jgi:hypothetical protein